MYVGQRLQKTTYSVRVEGAKGYVFGVAPVRRSAMRLQVDILCLFSSVIDWFEYSAFA